MFDLRFAQKTMVELNTAYTYTAYSTDATIVLTGCNE